MTCQNATATCDACERTVCSRCGRCYERLPTDLGTWRYRCPSRWCRYAKFLWAVIR